MKNRIESMNNHTHDGSQYDLEFMRGRIEFLGSSGHQNALALAEYLDLAEKLFGSPTGKVKTETVDFVNRPSKY